MRKPLELKCGKGSVECYEEDVALMVLQAWKDLGAAEQ